MENARHSFSTRTVARSLEHFHMRLLLLGYTDQEAIRGAAALTAFSVKCTREQAWEVANEITAQRGDAGAS